MLHSTIFRFAAAGVLFKFSSALPADPNFDPTGSFFTVGYVPLPTPEEEPGVQPSAVLLEGETLTLAPAGSTITPEPPRPARRPEGTAQDDRLHLIVAALLFISLVLLSVLAIRYLRRMPFQRVRPRGSESTTLAANPPNTTTLGDHQCSPTGPGFGFEGLSNEAWRSVRSRESSTDSGASKSGIEKPPVIQLKSDIHLPPLAHMFVSSTDKS